MNILTWLKKIPMTARAFIAVKKKRILGFSNEKSNTSTLATNFKNIKLRTEKSVEDTENYVDRKQILKINFTFSYFHKYEIWQMNKKSNTSTFGHMPLTPRVTCCARSWKTYDSTKFEFSRFFRHGRSSLDVTTPGRQKILNFPLKSNKNEFQTA